MTITFPTEVTLAGASVTSCSYTINGVTTVSTGMTTTATSPPAVKITDAFTGSSYAAGTAFYISCSGLRNPRTTAVTSSFSIYTTDSSGYAIESGTTGITT